MQAAEASELEPGDNVTVLKLVSRPSLNGKMGMVTAGLDEASGRVQVQIDGEPAPIALQPANLEDAGLPDGCRYFIAPSGSAAPAPAPKPKAARKERKEPKQQPAAKAAKPERKEPKPKPAAKAAKPKGRAAADLAAAVGAIVDAHANRLHELTPKGVRAALEEQLGLEAGALKERKDEINAHIDAALMALERRGSGAGEPSPKKRKAPPQEEEEEDEEVTQEEEEDEEVTQEEEEDDDDESDADGGGSDTSEVYG